MATFQDILDWLNQGATGDIPGTTPGGQTQPEPAAPSAQPTPAAFEGSTTTPQDFTGDLQPGMLDQYNALVQAGVPPSVAHHMLTQQGQPPQQDTQGQKPEGKAGGQQSAYQSAEKAGEGLWQGLFGKPQQTQQGGQAQDHQGLIDMLSNWFSPAPTQSSDWGQ